jgi:SEL1 protein
VAHQYFLRVARLVWPSDDLPKTSKGKEKRIESERELERSLMDAASGSAMFLGRMALRGEGGKGVRDYERARMWFELAADHVCLSLRLRCVGEWGC